MAGQSAVDQAYQTQLAKAKDAENEPLVQQIQEAHQVLSDRDSKTIYDCYLHRPARITNPLAISLLERLDVDERQTLDHNSQPFISNPFGAFNKLIPQSVRIDHQAALKMLDTFKPISSMDGDNYREFETLYDSLLEKAGIDKANAPPFVIDVSDTPERKAAYNNNHIGKQPFIVLSNEYLKSLTHETFEGIMAHEMGHLANHSDHIRPLRHALPLIKGVDKVLKPASVAVAVAAMALGALPLAAAAASIGLATILTSLGAQMVVRYHNHQDEYGADKVARNLTGTDKAPSFLLESVKKQEESIPNQRSKHLNQTLTKWRDIIVGSETHPTSVNRLHAIQQNSDINWTDRVSKHEENQQSVQVG